MPQTKHEIENYDLVRRAKEYAIGCHEATNHTYDGDKPYSVHLELVAQVALKYKALLPEAARDIVVCAAYCHDVIEDCRQTYNDVRKAVDNAEIADIVYACTNEKGKNRNGRANEKFYTELNENKLAVFVKLCDRIANVSYSKGYNSPKFTMYYKENEDFIAKLLTQGTDYDYTTMVAELRSLFEELDNI